MTIEVFRLLNGARAGSRMNGRGTRGAVSKTYMIVFNLSRSTSSYEPSVLHHRRKMRGNCWRMPNRMTYSFPIFSTYARKSELE